jgi:hypothetical protein
MKLDKGNIKKNFSVVESEFEQLKNSTMSNSQMIIKMFNSLGAIEKDYSLSKHLLQEYTYQFKVLKKYVSEVKGFSEEQFTADVEELKLGEWNAASLRDDEAQGLEVVEEILNEQDILIFSTVVPDADKGIFRSKMSIEEVGVLEFTEKAMNKKVGDTFEVTLNGDTHTVSVLGIRRAKNG